MIKCLLPKPPSYKFVDQAKKWVLCDKQPIILYNMCNNQQIHGIGINNKDDFVESNCCHK
jgi:hypothetical protein